MIDVEQALNECVLEIGGELVSSLVSKSPTFENADYLFRNWGPETVVAELKCLTTDLFPDGNNAKIDSLVEAWVERGLIEPFWGNREIATGSLPLECQRELFKLLVKPIKGFVTKANRQIKETKKVLGLDSAKGLLLLVNDGNYSLQSDMVMFLLNKALGNVHSGINSAVYFTVNMPARMPGKDMAVLVWLESHRKGIEGVSAEFLDRIRQGWFKKFEAITGSPTPVFSAEEHSDLEKVKFIRLPRPRDHYLGKTTELDKLRGRISHEINSMISACKRYDSGKRDEILRAAEMIENLVHGNHGKPSLLEDYFGKHVVKVCSSTMFSSSNDGHFLGFLGLQPAKAEFVPFLDDTKRMVSIPLTVWWEREFIMKIGSLGDAITRKELVLGISSRDGFSSNTAIQAKIKALAEGLGIAQKLQTAGGATLRVPFRNGHLAALRQISHELLRTDALIAFSQFSS